MALNIRPLATRALHDALRANLEASGLHPQQLGPLLGIPLTTLYKMQEWDEHGHRPAIHFWPDRIARLTEISGDDSYLRALCHDAGHIAVPAPDYDGRDHAELLDVIKANAEAVAVTCEVYRDGRVTADELVETVPISLAALTRNIDALVALKHRLEHDAERARARELSAKREARTLREAAKRNGHARQTAKVAR